jgi:hypothetical protein
MRCLSILAATLCLLFAPVAKADLRERAQIAGIIGSDRLRMFTYGKLLETHAAPRAVVVRMKQAMVRQGFYYDPGANRIIAAEAWAAPVLSYDGNINGGTLQDSFSYNGLVFDADPESRAKAGVVMGLSAGGIARLAWANGRYFEGQLRAEAVWSPKYNIGRSSTALGVCSRNHVTEWTFLDLCHTTSTVNRELRASTSQQTALSMTRLFQTDLASHEMTFEVARAQDADGYQPLATLTWAAVWDRAATKLSLTKAEPKRFDTALRDRIAADVQWLWGGRAVGVTLWQQRASGGYFLGSSRSDIATGISLSYQLRPNITAQIGYSTNHSNIDFFDVTQTSVNFRFNALQW